MKNLNVLLRSYRLQNRITHYSTIVKSDITDKTKFVPKCSPVSEEELDKLFKFVNASKKLFVITGAGISTESGIPDYRSEGVGLYATSKNRPVQFSDFLKSEQMRTRYWARNYVGWPLFSSFKPNLNHYTLADWESKGKVSHHVTQNVDSLLFKAGCTNLTELHGSAYRVACVDCGFRMTRHEMQDYIRSLNKDWSAKSDVLAPDSDVQLTEDQIKGFNVPTCPNCNQTRMKPEIVFFGDNVPKPIVEQLKETLSHSDAVLAIGTSLHVYSAYRFILHAKELKIPIGLLSIGNTRADQLATVKINAKCSEALSYINI